MQQRAWVTAAFVIMGYFALSTFRLHYNTVLSIWNERLPGFSTSTRDWKASEAEVVGAAVKQLTGPDDRIQCWGYMPGVYLNARRINASRFATAEKIGQVGDRAEFIRLELHDTLAARPPALMVMTADDYYWIQHPEEVGRPLDWLGVWLRGFMAEKYVQVAEIGGFNVCLFQRLDLAGR
jgi:hypothetical protein